MRLLRLFINVEGDADNDLCLRTMEVPGVSAHIQKNAVRRSYGSTGLQLLCDLSCEINEFDEVSCPVVAFSSLCLFQVRHQWRALIPPQVFVGLSVASVGSSAGDG